MKKIQTKKDVLKSMEDRGKTIIEGFAKEFNKIKRVDEGTVREYDASDSEVKTFDEFLNDKDDVNESDLSDEELQALIDADAEYEDRAHQAFNNANNESVEVTNELD